MPQHEPAIVETVDFAAARNFRLLAALLDHAEPPWPAGVLPPLGHWLLFSPDTLQSSIGTDGHPRREADGLPRRMWAGSRVRFIAPIPLDANVRRQSVELSVTDKEGKAGRMRFVTLRHRLFVGDTLAVEEEQDIVYRPAAEPGVPQAAPPPQEAAPAMQLERQVRLDPVALFRFSALTFNAHRIHYDRDYARSKEGYPALVVHGPFMATLLMDHFLRSRPDAQVTSFSFRAMRPVFDTDPFTLGLTHDETGADLAVTDVHGGQAMTARVELAPTA